MGFLPFFSFLPIFLPFLFASLAYSYCPITTCTNDTLTPIRFPFHLDHQRTENCSYPGFDLHCTDRGHTAITLPHSGEFLVRHINYETQMLLVNDPNDCLPGRLLEGFDPSGTPFQADFYDNYTFLSCPRDFTDARFDVIDCLSNSTRTVIATSLTDFTADVSRACQLIRTVPVPFSLSENGGFTSILRQDVLLSWFVPDCKDCEARGRVCGFESNGNRQIGCFIRNIHNSGDPEQTENSQGLKVFRIIAFSIAIPAIACAVGVGIFLCMMDRRERLRSAQVTRTLQQITGTAQPLDTTMGLDQGTIDSYTKVVLGESRRVPGRNDGSCPICLSDFSAKETLRCIPDCQHCFHADCIDEWLKLNGTCPLCRTSPAHHAQV